MEKQKTLLEELFRKRLLLSMAQYIPPSLAQFIPLSLAQLIPMEQPLSQPTFEPELSPPLVEPPSLLYHFDFD